MVDARRHAEELVLAERQRRKALQTPAREQQRKVWRTAFEDLSGREAATLARQTFRPMVETPAAGPFHRGRVADEYVNEHLAVVEGAGPNGESAVVTSPTPLTAVDETGQLAPVDINLQRSAEGWTPVNPVEPYAIGDSSESAVAFDSGWAIGMGGEDVQGRPEGETVFYPNTQIDTDAFVKPAADGAEVFWQLRSQASPQDLRLKLELPAGAQLAGPAPDGVTVVRDGETIGFISAPVATDAESRTVPTTMRIDGQDVVVEVAHRNRDVAYPIAVDPQLQATFNFPVRGLDAFNYWGRYVYGRYDVWGGDGNWGRGLNIVSQNYGPPAEYIAYNAGDRAGLYYTAPGAAKIFKVTNTLSRNITGEALANCMLVGIANAAINNWEGPYGTTYGEGCGPFAQYAWTVQTGSPTPGNTFLFGAYRYSATPTAFWLYFRDATIYMIDDDLPGISSLGTPPAWTDGSNGAAVNVLAGDYSTGIKNINVIGPPAWNGTGTSTNPNCAYGPCSKSFSVSRPIGNMPEGAHTISVSATDPSGNATPVSTRTIRVDRSPPTISASGLANRDDEFVGTGAPDLTFSATDGNGASPASQRSGISSVRLEINGMPVQTWRPGPNGCTAPQGSCSVDGSYSFDPVGKAQGEYDFQLIATDHVGLVTVQGFSVHVGSEVTGIGTDEVLAPDPDDAEYLSDPALRLQSGDPDARRDEIVWGLSDGNARTFRTARVDALDLEAARHFIEFDIVRSALTEGAQDASGLPPEEFYLRAAPPNDTAEGGPGSDLQRFDRWMDAVCPKAVASDPASRVCEQEPLIAFNYDRNAPFRSGTNSKEAPELHEYRDGIRKFMMRYPVIQHYTAWNEPNRGVPQQGEVEESPTLAARYYIEAYDECQIRGCTVAAGDFLDNNEFYEVRDGVPDANDPEGSTDTWIDEQGYGFITGSYFDLYRRVLEREQVPVEVWAFHAYTTINSLSSARLKQFLQWTGGAGGPPVWLTEQGGIISVNTPDPPNPADTDVWDPLLQYESNDGNDRGARAIRFLAGFWEWEDRGLIHRFPRIEKVFVHGWRDNQFDSGLVEFWRPRARGAYFCLRLATASDPAPGTRDDCKQTLDHIHGEIPPGPNPGGEM